MRLNNQKNLYLALTLVIGTLCSCVVEEGENVPTGSLGVYLHAENNGVRYQLPENTRLLATNGGVDAAFWLLDDDDIVATRILPVGVFEVELTHGDVAGGVWPLTRIAADGSQTIVNAMLLSPNPATVEITEHQTTSLTLSFELESLDTIVFSNGSLDVSVDITAPVLWNDSVQIESENYRAEAPEGLSTILHALGEAYDISIDSFMVDNWYHLGTNTVCIHTERIRHEVTNSGEGVALVLAETLGESGKSRVCVTDNGEGTVPRNDISITHWRTGPSITALNGVLTGTEYTFTVHRVGSVQDEILELSPLETRLDLQQLLQPTLASGSFFSVSISIEEENGEFTNLYTAYAFDSPFSVRFSSF